MWGCPTCGEQVGFNAKRCKSCGRTVSYMGNHNVSTTTTSCSSSSSESEESRAAAAAAASAFLAARRGQQAAGSSGEGLATRAQLTPVETLGAVELCAHLNSLRCEQVHRALRQVVQRLMLHPLNQNWFNAPVDAKALNLPDYHDLIKRPMDLGTVKSRLSNLEYPNAETFAADARLVFENAMTYNPPRNAVHHAAVEMLKDFEADLERAMERQSKQAARSDEHECGLCQGKACALCGDKCLTFETPALICSGPCAQKVRRDQHYHVTRDGSRLWCHKCYLGLKSVIPPPPELAAGGDETRFGTATASANNASAAVGLWYKRDLIKRKFDEDVAEPWVQCDACSRWVHQTCALFNAKAEADTGDSHRFVCPLCELQAFAAAASAAASANDSEDEDDEASEGAATSNSSTGIVKREGSDDSSSSEPTPIPARKPARLSALAPSSLVLEEEEEEEVEEEGPRRPSLWGETATKLRPATAAIEATRRGGGGVYDLKLVEGKSWHAAAAAAASKEDDDNEIPPPPPAPPTPPSSSSSSRRRRLVQEPSTKKKWWSARALRKTRMTDHLEAAVKRRLRTCGEAAVADTVCVRVLSAVPQSLRVPGVLRRNFKNPDGGGGELPEVLPFESRAVSLFQRTDGVDVCVFSMYVHEFGDEGSEGPSAKRVYIAYLDSVEYFRPRTARTAVYHELLVSYLDWSRRRGFRAAHIWACPPQRGNNFIFWCHPPHQRTPSRERLADWYKAMIKRARDVGAVSRVSTLYDEYYAHLDEQRRRCASSAAALVSGAKGHHHHHRKRGKLDAVALVRRASSLSSLSSRPQNDDEDEDDDDDGSISKAELPAAAADESSCPGRKRPRPPPSTAEKQPLPDCPPLFDGDYWPEEACRLHSTIERRSVNGRPNAYASALRSAGEASLSSQLDSLLKHVTQQPSAYPFMRPVDADALGVPDYHAVIQRPMDLGTVNGALETGKYETAQGLVDDVRLVFRNAQVYNPPAHPVHEAASHLSLVFEKKLQSLLARLKHRLDAPDPRDILAAFPLADADTSTDPAATLAAAKAAKRAKAALAKSIVPAMTTTTTTCDRRDEDEEATPSDEQEVVVEQPTSVEAADHPDGRRRRREETKRPAASRTTTAADPPTRSTRRRRTSPVPPREEPAVAPQPQSPPEDPPPVPAEPHSEEVSSTRSSDPCPRLPVELAASVFKMKDSLFVLHLQPEAAAAEPAASVAKDEVKPKPGRKRRLPFAPVPEEVGPAAAASDAAFYGKPRFSEDRIQDPDAGSLISCSLLDSRHTFLEMCQFWHYQFDTLRRAKHSSIMLLYHLHNPKVDSLRIVCSHCAREIRRVRWHCSTCVDYNICRECERIVRTIHSHTLTPYRITFTRRRQLSPTA
ncbi:hypothetical protein CTAYLR_001653 [Chrysophaeum taylorii]|uniref:histone acetyltransferase n=1 Tax=Chrysophaeum taylorii TaxID=2483200 RepID=A0AAD7UC59_9STRA|nr:hypothetical protein CTAYLR_001653 [Chrysophaeum taylorii]